MGGDALTAGGSSKGRPTSRSPRPAYTEKFANVGPVLRFAQPATQLVFDASALELPLTMADPVSRQLVYSELERSLEELGGDQDLLGRVRKLVGRAGGGFRSLDEVASALHLDARTLKRRLATQGATYSTISSKSSLARART